jgi:hypothetical protein
VLLRLNYSLRHRFTVALTIQTRCASREPPRRVQGRTHSTHRPTAAPRPPPRAAAAHRLTTKMPRRLLLRILLLLPSIQAFFVVLDGEKECFLIEQPLDTQLTIKYELPANEKTEDKRVKVTLTDRRTKTQIFSKVVSDHKSELSMATGSEAAHDLCLKPQSPGKIRVNLEIERGHGQKYYAEMASENKMALTQRPV